MIFHAFTACIILKTNLTSLTLSEAGVALTVF